MTTRAILALALVLWFTVQTAYAQNALAFFEPANMAALCERIRPQLEAVTGLKFSQPPTVVVSTRVELGRLLTTELLPQVKLYYPDLPDDKLKLTAFGWGQLASFGLFAKYEPTNNTIMVVPENFASNAKLLHQPTINTEDFLRTVLTHEMTHALDEENYHVVSDLLKSSTRTELEVRNALVEGHAQYVTRKVLSQTHEDSLFSLLDDSITAAPQEMGEGDKFMLSIQLSSLDFAYHDGRKFFEGLEQSHPEQPFVSDVFTHPPTSKSVILHPESYYAPPAAPPAALNLDALWTKLKTIRPQWTSTVLSLDEAQLRAAAADLVDPAVINEVGHNLVRGQILSCTPADAPGQRLLLVAIYQMTSAQAADQCFDMNVAMLHQKDERLKTGNIHIVSAAYRQLPLAPPMRHLLATKNVAAGSQTLVVKDLLGVVGTCGVEIIFSNEPTTDDELVNILQDIISLIPAPPP